MKLVHNEENNNSFEHTFSLTDELRAAEEKFYHLFDFNPCPMSVHDLTTGNIIDINQSFLDSLGFESKIKVVGKSIVDYEVIPQKEAKSFMRKIIDDGSVKNMPIVFKNLKGKKIKGLFSGTKINLNGWDCVLIVCQVISKQCIINSLLMF